MEHRCVVTNMQWSKNPEGQTTYFTYDAAGRPTQSKQVANPQAGLADIVTSTTYAGPNPKTAGKPSSITDALGNVTTNSYDSQHGGLVRTIAPAINGISPVKRFAYQQRRAWVKNANGTYSPQSPIWLLSEERTCRTTATSGSQCGGGATDEVVTSYDYGPDNGSVGNNLLLRGVAVTSNSVTMRTCYGYDSMGNRIWQTSPRAGLAGCY